MKVSARKCITPRRVRKVRKKGSKKIDGGGVGTAVRKAVRKAGGREVGGRKVGGSEVGRGGDTGAVLRRSARIKMPAVYLID